MRKLFLFVLVFIQCVALNAQSEDNVSTSVNVEVDKNYKLFPTQNMWIFLKLDTRTGEIWMVQYSVDDDIASGEVVLNPRPLAVFENEKRVGRFTLYPTQNMYNFLLLDTVNGDVWQVQWSFEEKNRGILKIN